MSTIVTQGYGLRRESIIVKGYGRRIEEIVVDIVERLHQKRVGSSGFKLKRDKEEECITIIASLLEANKENLSVPISNEIRQCFNDESIGIKIQSVDVAYTSQQDLKIEITFKSKSSKKKKIDVKASIKK